MENLLRSIGIVPPKSRPTSSAGEVRPIAKSSSIPKPRPPVPDVTDSGLAFHPPVPSPAAAVPESIPEPEVPPMASRGYHTIGYLD